MTTSRRQLIAGNWKMYTARAEAVRLAERIAGFDTTFADVLICPPFPWLIPVADALRGSPVQLGAQDVWPGANGAFTGGVSTAMLSELVTHVIVGHSERRQVVGENNELVRAKLGAVLSAGLTPILCVGESLATRESGDAESFVRGQLISALSECSPDERERCVVAYEPIWAIGTGRAASAADAESMATAIRTELNLMQAGAGESIRILYGGSVTPANAVETLAQPNVDGALVGGASLHADAFGAIVAAARH